MPRRRPAPGATGQHTLENGINLAYLIESYRQIGGGESFFLPIFDKLTGVNYIREMIVAGAGADEIKSRWKGDVERFLVQRKPYLLYEE